jgi:hypothetical protein
MPVVSGSSPPKARAAAKSTSTTWPWGSALGPASTEASALRNDNCPSMSGDRSADRALRTAELSTPVVTTSSSMGPSWL